MSADVNSPSRVASRLLTLCHNHVYFPFRNIIKNVDHVPQPTLFAQSDTRLIYASVRASGITYSQQKGSSHWRRLSDLHVLVHDPHDRNLNGGGVCFFVQSSLRAAVITPECHISLESLYLKISIPAKPKPQKFIICTVYRPPASTVQFWDDFRAQLDSVSRVTSPLICTWRPEH